ncbi:MAG TPA: L-aspartate oxidase, partial [Verrucomicrobiales bacterium]|nr:L-aspartate oxidase [Verrucomicrobiales bacterium]
KAGAGLCREEVVRTIVSEGPERIASLIALGLSFSEREIPDSGGAREWDLGKEGGHSKRRILHCKDMTGKVIEQALLTAIAEDPNIEVLEDHFAIDLITSEKASLPGESHCLGAYVL